LSNGKDLAGCAVVCSEARLFISSVTSLSRSMVDSSRDQQNLLLKWADHPNVHKYTTGWVKWTTPKSVVSET